jgi:[ribosomal protein S18]-alanine N-acetyltransferase
VAARIRESSSEDFKELWRIDQQCFAPGISYSQRELAYYMAQRGAFTLVAEDEGRIVGFVVGQRHPRAMGHIITIDVIAEARRSGIGAMLMDASEARLKAEGCDSIYLETAVDNSAAVSFYKRRGYYVLKTIPRYYLNRIDALLMGKKLE